jgi:hypothetical protein
MSIGVVYADFIWTRLGLQMCLGCKSVKQNVIAAVWLRCVSDSDQVRRHDSTNRGQWLVTMTEVIEICTLRIRDIQ